MQDALRRYASEPVGLGDLEGGTHAASGENPVCGDRLRIELRADAAGGVEALAFRASACPACVAVASCAVEVLAGSTLPLRVPSEALRARVRELGGLSRFEEHALALVEDVLRRLARV